MNLSVQQLMERYVQSQRALGRRYAGEERVLLSVRHYLEAQGLTDLDQTGFDDWCRTFAHLTPSVIRHRQLVVRRWCLYRRRYEQECFVPSPEHFARTAPHRPPFILEPTDVARLLVAARHTPATIRSPLRPAVLRLAIELLYTAGLRRGELLRLTLADVDAKAGVLRVRESKFHKSRLVPLSADAQRELRQYLKQRRAIPLDTGPDTPLLCHYSGRNGSLRGYTGTGLGNGLRTLLREAEVQNADGKYPRIHDFRHSFAVQAMLRWYQQGADVQANLPKLAMYLGHVSIISTAYYLQWVPALAQAASQRFEAKFGTLIQGDKL